VRANPADSELLIGKTAPPISKTSHQAWKPANTSAGMKEAAN
jgi:hypothetical protein